jgi:hypothetical protein
VTFDGLVAKLAQFYQKIAKNGAILNKIFYLSKLQIKIWKFIDKKEPKSRAYLNRWILGDFLTAPKGLNFAQSGHTGANRRGFFSKYYNVSLLVDETTVL